MTWLLSFALSVTVCCALRLHQIQPVPGELQNGQAMLFDLDNTLYTLGHLRRSKQLLKKKLGKQYLIEKTDFSERATSRLLTDYRVRYNKMAVLGIVKELGLDGAEFEEYVDTRADLEFVIGADPELGKFLPTVLAPRYVMTNSGLKHALTVLEALGVTNQLHGILYVDYRAPKIYTKPDPQVYREAQKLLGIDDPKKINFVDDTLVYVEGAKDEGWNAVLLDPKNETCAVQELPCIKSLYDLPAVFPHLFP